MIRFILRRITYCMHTDRRTENFETIDGDMAAVEKALMRGGEGPSGFDQTDFVGIEVIQQEQPQ